MADEREIQRTLTDLRPNTRYIVRARTVNGFGIASEWSEALDFTTGTDESIPKPPTDLFAEFNNSDLLIRWTAPIANTDWTPLIDFSHYEITLTPSPAADPEYFIHETSEIAYVFSYQLNTAVWNTAQNVFLVEVRAVDTAGNMSEAVSTTATATGTITETGITAEELEDFGVLFESYFDAGTVLYAAVDNTPVATTIAQLKVLLNISYATDIGNGSDTEFTITHNLNTRDISVTVRETAAPYGLVYPEIQIDTTNAVGINFSVPPTTNQYRVIVFGAT